MRKPVEFLLPSWVPGEAWDAYVEMRKKIKKPLTEYASILAVRKLGDLLRGGHQPQDVLDQSTFNCWQGLYAIREMNSPTEDENEAAIRRVFGKSTS